MIQLYINGGVTVGPCTKDDIYLRIGKIMQISQIIMRFFKISNMRRTSLLNNTLKRMPLLSPFELQVLSLNALWTSCVDKCVECWPYTQNLKGVNKSAVLWNGGMFSNMQTHASMPNAGTILQYVWFNSSRIIDLFHQMETFSALLALCAGNSPVTGEFPVQRPVTRSFDERLNKRLSKQSWGWWYRLHRPIMTSL